MLNLFGRQRQAETAAGDEAHETPLKSHVLPRFVKRIRGLERPAVLDLGRLSGGNIEFFGRIGCRLQIEDLLTCLEERAGADPAGRPADASSSRTPRREDRIVPASQSRPVPPAAPRARNMGLAIEPAPADVAHPQRPVARSGRRPSRHIVLPPRTFARSGESGPKVRRSVTLGSTSWKSHLPTTFSFPDESFHAVVAWDVIDFYDPESARRVAAEVRRILKAGGLILSFFHAKRAAGPDQPRRYRILDENHFSREATNFPPMPRQVYQNRDIEKMFAGLKIIEQYYLKNGLREILMEKRSAAVEPVRPRPATSGPKPRFRID